MASEQEGVGPGALSPGVVQQLRQMSLPLWVRLSVLAVSLGVLGIAVYFFVKGIAAPSLQPDWFELSAKIFGAAFLPFLAVAYLAFAETGVVALLRKTQQTLTETIPDAIRSATGSEDGFDPAGFSKCHIATGYREKSSSVRYRISVDKDGSRATLRCVVTLNVSKAVVVIFVPDPLGTMASSLAATFTETIAGAEHEGYRFDAHKAAVTVGGRPYLKVVARRTLHQDFLWDPGKRLYFAQDLSAYLLSLLSEGWLVFSGDTGSCDA